MGATIKKGMGGMLTARMLVVLYGLLSEDEATECALSALSRAASPYGVRFAVSYAYRSAFEALGQSDKALGAGDVKYYDESLALQAIPPLLTDETHFLFCMGAHAFSEKWDKCLYERMKRVSERPALLSATLGAQSEGLPAQAYLTGFGDRYGENGVALTRGLPLVLSQAPVRTLAVDPALLFGTVDFLRRVTLELSTLSVAAYVAAYPVYALDRAPLYPLAPAPTRSLTRPESEALPGTTLARFEQQAGFRFNQERAGVKTTWGLFFTEDTYPQQFPKRLATRARLRALKLHVRESLGDLPLVVTAFKDWLQPQKPVPVYMLRFGFLKAIRCLPLILYTGGAQERYLRSVFPNAWSYPDNGVLPQRMLYQGMTTEQHFRRGKPALMQRALQKHPEFSHVAWANVDLLKHPVCPEAIPDFSALMDDRIHLATVNGIPDASFVVLPARLATWLARETLAMTQLDVELKRSLTEEALWQRLADKYPELFTLHPTPKKHLLMLTAFDSQLLCEETRARLQDLQPPRRLEKKGNETNGHSTQQARAGQPRRAGAHRDAGGRELRL